MKLVDVHPTNATPSSAPIQVAFKDRGAETTDREIGMTGRGAEVTDRGDRTEEGFSRNGTVAISTYLQSLWNQ
jgi:hypothetical protein